MKLPAIALVAVASAALGFFLGRSSTAPPISKPVVGNDVTAVVPSTAGTSTADASSAEGTEQQQLEVFTPDSLKALVRELESDALGAGARAQAWAEFYARLENSDIPALAFALASANEEQLEPGLRAIYAAWAEKDPTAAWNSAVSFSVGGQCNKAMHAVLDAVAKNDPSAGLAMAEALENPGLRDHMTDSALHALAKSDPARAFDVALRSAERGDDSAFYSVLSRWVREDPAAAQRAVVNLQGQLGDQARLSVVQGLTEKDPEAAWNYAIRLPPPIEDYSYWDPRTRVIDLWSKSDPQKAIQAALNIKDQEIRNNAVASAIGNWASADFAAAFSYVNAINDPGLRGNALAELSSHQGADPAAMFEVLLDQAPAGDAFGNALSRLMSRWARSNPREAAAAALQLPAGEALVSSARNIASEWTPAAPDKNEVLGWVGQLPQGRARSEAMESVFQIWSSQDPGGAQRAWSALGAKDKEEIFSSITEGWSRTQPAEAARWAVSMADQPGGSQALERAISAWSQSAPNDAATFVEKAPDNVRSGLTSQLIDRWYSADPLAAAEWLKRQPAGPAKDAGVMAMASEISGENPQIALDWTKSIVDQGNRDMQVRNILSTWMRNDSVAALNWIRTASLPAETKAELLQGAP